MREQNKYGVEQLTAEEAIAFGESGIWEHWSLEEIATFQLFQERLCVPFDKFQEAMQQVLGRPVWTHEFADYDRLVGEYWGEKPKPTFEEIISLIPEEKRIIVQM